MVEDTYANLKVKMQPSLKTGKQRSIYVTLDNIAITLIKMFTS